MDSRKGAVTGATEKRRLLAGEDAPQVFMSPSLQARIDTDLIVDDVHRAYATCRLMYKGGELEGRLNGVTVSKDVYEVSLTLKSQMLQESLECNEFNKVVIIKDDNKVSHRDIQGSWCQRKDIIINEYTGEINLVLSATREDI